jgi:hypothetical protein
VNTQILKRATVGALSIAALSLPVLAVSTPAEAAGGLALTKVYVNSPGSDLPVTNKKLNGEYVTIKNTSKSTKTLTGYTVRDTSNHVYVFGSYKLKAGKSVKVHTGKGKNTSANRFMNRGYFVWNNSGGDSATLKSANGAKVDSCAWGKKLVKSSVKC